MLGLRGRRHDGGVGLVVLLQLGGADPLDDLGEILVDLFQDFVRLELADIALAQILVEHVDEFLVAGQDRCWERRPPGSP